MTSRAEAGAPDTPCPALALHTLVSSMLVQNPVTKSRLPGILLKQQVDTLSHVGKGMPRVEQCVCFQMPAHLAGRLPRCAAIKAPDAWAGTGSRSHPLRAACPYFVRCNCRSEERRVGKEC